MPSSVLSFSNWELDTPWRRLYWTLPAAVIIWLVILWSFAVFMSDTTKRLPEPPPVDAQLVEISEPPQTLAPSTPKQTRPLAEPPTVPQPSLEKEPPTKPETKPVEEAAPTPPKEDKPPVKPEPVQVPNNAQPYTSARAISQPIPQIPDELRQDALSTSAVARFHVAPDGTTTAELVKPTPNPKLNRLLLNTLKNWRFFPAMKDGKPVESTQEIVIKIQVK
jgi:protein TonB